MAIMRHYAPFNVRTTTQLICLLLVIGTISIGQAQTVTQYVTTGDQSKLLEKQSETPEFSVTSNGNPTLSFDASTTYQSMEGFGYTLTQGSAYVLMTEITDAQRAALLSEMFDPASGIAPGVGSSFLRIAIGASDLSQYAYTYNDLPAGQTDEDQSEFSLQGPDLDYVIPVLQEIVAINPGIKIKAVPWTAPAWMKTNGSLSDGHLKPEYYNSYATYFVKYLQAMDAHGIPIYAVAPQNEPEHCCNNPAMLMTAQEQIDFIMELGPAIQNAGYSTKILTWDHNCDNPDYPKTVFGSAAGQYVDGAAWHLYAGDISAMSEVHDAYPSKDMYFTEQYTSSGGSFLGDLAWHMKNVMIGGTNNWARAVLEWNLAADANDDPHTEGGCTDCLGAYTVDAGSITKNVAYYNVAHFSKFVRPGALRVGTVSASGLACAGFINTTEHGETRVMVVHNDNNRPTTTFNIEYEGKIVTLTLPNKSVGTYIWNDSGSSNAAPVASFTYTATDLSVDFDGSGSSDSDGTISSWDWDFGDGNTGSGELASHTYGASGDYTVTLTVTDDGGATDAESQVVSVTDGSTTDPTTLHVESIVTGTINVGQGNKKGTATVTIHDDQGGPVLDATVTGTFSGTFSETVSGVTNADGTVTLETSSTAKGGVTVEFCVDDVVHGALTYDSTQNVVTCSNESSGRMGSVPGLESEEGITVYPNPLRNNNLSIAVNHPEISSLALSIISVAGKVVFRDQLKSGKNQLSLPYTLNKGIYILHMNSGQITLNKWLIVE